MLTPEVAQNIVSRTMEILNYNINVMDNKGVIIASGDRDRIGTIHEGAKEIQKKRDNIEISAQEEQVWKGVKQGINLPICFQEEVMGTVGITGATSEVRRYGELVKMTAEMIIEQSFLLKQIQYDERIKREFTNQWISGKGLTEGVFLKKAKFLGVDLSKKRGIIVINLQMENNYYIRASLEKLEKAFAPLLNVEDVLSIINENIIIIKCAESNLQLSNTAKQWAGYFGRDDLLFTTGHVYDNYKDIIFSYEQAINTLDVSKKLEVQDKVIPYDERIIDVLIHKLFKDEATIMGFPIYNPLPKNKENKELLQTLECFIDNNGQINKTASDLYIHRNTLTYRLEKIYDLTGKDPRKIKDLFYLYCICLLKNKFY
ncbi:helix-turn-helix domain-containing protein [Salipaludibacillus sp. CUR1]|uniref:CdaR family transcriptional regulator n=1 Tax=Salipaludibacillus sp. CUR1 TaxID=2820003 RepID=UPI001E5EA0F4|nr:helix-turn-helix domain-containing protein [Salipaludibacillus sp. CUR1]